MLSTLITGEFANGLPEAKGIAFQKQKAPFAKGALKKFTHRWLHPNLPQNREIPAGKDTLFFSGKINR